MDGGMIGSKERWNGDGMRGGKRICVESGKRQDRQSSSADGMEWEDVQISHSHQHSPSPPAQL